MRSAEEPRGNGQVAKIHALRAQVVAGLVRVSLHANREMVAEGIMLAEIYEAIASGEVLEDYPEHRRGACCLLYGVTGGGRHLHVVCTTANPLLVIITVYEPKPPKWATPTQREARS